MPLTIDINSSCPLACEYCYQDKNGELSQEAIFDLVERYPQFDSVELGGGEPLLHKNILSLMRGMQVRQKKLHVSTSAVFIPEGLFDLENLVKQNTQIQVSLPAADKKVYQEITGKDLFYPVLENAMNFAFGSGFPSLISMAVYQKNLQQVPAVLDLAISLDVPLRINLVFPVGRAKNLPLLSTREVDQLRGYLLTQRVVRGNFIDSPLIHKNSCPVLERVYGIKKELPCSADYEGKTYVSADGKISGCEFQTSDVNFGGIK